MLRTLPEEKKTKWSEYVPKVVHAYNCMKSESTGFSPFYLLFGRSPRLPLDLVFGPSLEVGNVTHTEYAYKWKVLKEAYSLARKNTSKSATDGKRQYDRKVRVSNLKPDDRVLVRNLSDVVGQGNSGRIRKIRNIRCKRAERGLTHVQGELGGTARQTKSTTHESLTVVRLPPCRYSGVRAAASPREEEHICSY